MYIWGVGCDGKKEAMPKVYEFVAHVRDDRSGPAGDGSFTFRFTNKADAVAAAKGKMYFGEPANVTESEVSTKLLARWRREGKIR